MQDTLTMARRLIEAGMEAQQAEALAEVFREFADRQVTPVMLEAAVDKVEGRIETLRAETQSKFSTLDAKMTAGFEQVRADMRTQAAETQKELSRAMVRLGLAFAAFWAATFFAALYFVLSFVR